MGLLYPVTGVKFVFASSVLLCVVGWFSVVQTHLARSPLENCPQQQHLQEWKVAKRQLIDANNNNNNKQTAQRHRLRVLMGIFTMDKPLQMPYRRQFRQLFKVFPMYNDTRVCSLHDFELAPNDEVRYQCQFIYTFVLGGNKKDKRTELVDDSASILVPDESMKNNIWARDLRINNDATYLNIRENMNGGKSQTWFKYASTIMKKYDLDYVGKIDSDSLPYMDKFFSWAHVYLPPPPYNSGILAGVPIDKLWWNRNKRQFDEAANEDFFKTAYGKVMHLYAAGQCYILSRDLAETVALEAPRSHSYREGHEDHDVSAMAFHSTKPISFHFLSLQQQFWRHPVKRYKKKIRQWRTLWHNENLRLKQVLERRQKELQQKKAAQLAGAADDDTLTTPDQLAAPVQMELEDHEGDEEEDEADVDENGNSAEDLERR